jgi:hypothetical protein
MSGDIIERAVEFAYKHFTAAQVCWICLVATMGVAWFVTSRYATAGEVFQLRSDLTEVAGDAIAKRIYDYRIRQCDTPAEQRQDKRWLVEQMRIDVEKYQKVTGRQFLLPQCGEL